MTGPNIWACFPLGLSFSSSSLKSVVWCSRASTVFSRLRPTVAETHGWVSRRDPRLGLKAKTHSQVSGQDSSWSQGRDQRLISRPRPSFDPCPLCCRIRLFLHHRRSSLSSLLMPLQEDYSNKKMITVEILYPKQVYKQLSK